MHVMWKGTVAAVVLALTFLSNAPPASALSFQVRGGTIGGDQGEGTNVGLDAFFYEGRSFDFFVSCDFLSASDSWDLSTPGGTVSATIDADTTAVVLGFRYKFTTESSWKPFLSLGIGSFSTEFTPQAGLESYFAQPFKNENTGMRLSAGFDVGVGDNWSIGFEAGILTNVYYYEEGWFGGGPMLDKYGTVSQLNMGIRYHLY